MDKNRADCKPRANNRLFRGEKGLRAPEENSRKEEDGNVRTVLRRPSPERLGLRGPDTTLTIVDLDQSGGG